MSKYVKYLHTLVGRYINFTLLNIHHIVSNKLSNVVIIYLFEYIKYAYIYKQTIDILKIKGKFKIFNCSPIVIYIKPLIKACIVNGEKQILLEFQLYV